MLQHTAVAAASNCTYACSKQPVFRLHHTAAAVSNPHDCKVYMRMIYIQCLLCLQEAVKEEAPNGLACRPGAHAANLHAHAAKNSRQLQQQCWPAWWQHAASSCCGWLVTLAVKHLHVVHLAAAAAAAVSVQLHTVSINTACTSLLVDGRVTVLLAGNASCLSWGRCYCC